MNSNLAFAQPSQRIELPSSPNPVGSGARALGMGGAFIAIADDATAASWNPGGLIQLEKPEISFVGAYFSRTEDNYFGINPEASGPENVSNSNLNYLSLAYPFTCLGNNMIVSLNYQYLFDFTRKASFHIDMQSDTTTIHQNIDYRMKGGLSALGLAYCLQITPKFSFGLTLNIWEDCLYQNSWEQKTHQWGLGTEKNEEEYDDFSFEYTSFSRYSLSGLNANLGILWNINSTLTFGAVLKTPFTADLVHEFKSTYTDLDPNNATINDNDIYHEKLDMPMSYGVGLSFRFSDKFTAAIDVYRTEWDNFLITDPNGCQKSPITLALADKSNVDPTTQVRVGAEYLFIGQKYIIPFRCGIFYDSAPAEGKPDDYYGFSLGSGLAINRFIFDITYQYRFGHDVGKFMLPSLDFSQDVHEHTVYSSMIIHF